MDDLQRWRARHARRRAKQRERGYDHALQIAYEGSAFAGYARQPGRDTVEGALREALAPLAPGLRRMAVAGRTDRGVSASGQVVSFRADAPVPVEQLERAVDGVRPGALVCLAAQLAPPGFHAQFWAVERRYRYFLPGAPELAPLDRMLSHLEGRRCFARFGRELPEGRSTVRTLRRARCRPGHRDQTPGAVFELAANGFLRRMVRVVVAEALYAARAGLGDAALLQIATGARPPAPVRPAPPEGLCLLGASYPPVDPRLG